MMSEDDDFDYTSTNQSSGNLATIFHGAPPTSTTAPATAPVKQAKKDSSPRVMIATVLQTYFLGTDQKWTPKGKMGIALLSTDNTNFQLIIYLSKTQQITSARITTSFVFTAQSNNYLSFHDDSGQTWSVMFEAKQGMIDFALQIVLAKAHLFSFKFDHIVQDIREGEGLALADHESAEISLNTYKVLENGTLQANDSGESKSVKFKIGKQQNGKAFDDVLRGMKKSGQRVAAIGRTLYNIEITRIKREKEARSNSNTTQAEDLPPVEHKRSAGEDHENDRERNRMLQRLNRMGGISMVQNPNQSSAFVATHYSDDDSINNEFIQNGVPTRSVQTPVQFMQGGYHHPQALIQQGNMYSLAQQHQQTPVHDYTIRPGSAMTGMPYHPTSMWPSSQFPPTTPSIPPTDMYYQQQQHPPMDMRQLLNRLTEKVDGLNEKLETKNSPNYPNMETSILLANIQRIVKENESVKKDLFDRSAKVEELNMKISDLLDRNQKLIEKSHLTAEQRNDVVNNVSEQTAQKILDLEKQKVELTNNLSVSTSKIAELQLQLNQYTQDTNDNQSRLTSLTHKCEQYKDELLKSETQRLEIQTKFETIQEHYKNEKLSRKQLQSNFNTLEEELAEVRTNGLNLEKVINERKTKYETERKRYQEEIEEQKQLYEKELDELRTKLRQKRTNENLANTQEVNRIEQELAKEWQDKLDRQQAQHERLFTSKTRELQELNILFEENELKLSKTIAELDQSEEQSAEYQERCEKLQERLVLMREKMIEINDEQPQVINEQVKQAINIIFQRLKNRIQPAKRYTGEQFLTRSLQTIKKATLKVLSNDENEEEDEDEDESSSEEENDQATNVNSLNEQTLNEEVTSIQTEERKSSESEASSTTNNPKNGWDTVDDFQQETTTLMQTTEQIQTIEQEDTTVIDEYSASTDEQSEIRNLDPPPVQSNEEVSVSNVPIDEGEESDGSTDTVEENDEKVPPVLELPEEGGTSDEDDDNALFQSARPSIQEILPISSVTQSSTPSKTKLNPNTPFLPNLDDSDDEMFK